VKNLIYKSSLTFFSKVERGLCLILKHGTLKSLLVSGEELRYTAMLLYQHYAEYEDVCSVCAKNG